MLQTYSTLIKQAIKAGFEEHQGTYKYADGVSGKIIEGSILLNTKPTSQFNGEVLDIYEDGSFDHYSQFKGTSLNFKFK